MNVDSKVLEQLRHFDTPTVCNVIELLDVRPRNEGFMSGEIKAMFPEFPPAVGFAATATFRSARPVEEGDSYSLLGDQVESFLENVREPRVVVFQDIDHEPKGATFGEVMCTVYKAFGCVGLVTSGGARDLDQVRKLGFPCWASSVIPSHAYCRIVETDVPVEVGGCAVRPGDLIHADANGVTTIPTEIISEIAAGCQLVADAEEGILGYVRTGSPNPAGLRDAQGRCKDAFARVSERVKEILAG